MGQFKDLSGMKFGRWTVIGRGGYNKHGALLWSVVCSCGTAAGRTTNNLKHTNSCGCFNKERLSLARKGQPSPARKGYGVSTFNMLRSRYIQRAREKELQYALSDDFLKETFSKPCTYCGVSPKSVMRTKETYGEYIYNGLDRVNSSLGYTEDNVVPCCTRCNQMKNNMTTGEFLEKIKEIYERRNSWRTIL